MADYRVNLDIFAGPMDLLLYLVRKEEVDIYDIPIAESRTSTSGTSRCSRTWISPGG